MEQPLTIGYWKIRGLIEPIRLLLEYCNVPYQEVKYDGSKGANGVQEWNEHKQKYHQDSAFPNLPYLIDGERHITESGAIQLYVILKANREDLLGSNLDERWKCQQIMGVQGDLNSVLVSQSYNQEYQSIKEANLNDRIIPKLKQIEEHYNRQNTKFMVSDEPKLCDFKLYESLKHAGFHYEKLFEQFKSLQQYIQNFEQLENIQKYRSSTRFNERPLNNPRSAQFY